MTNPASIADIQNNSATDLSLDVSLDHIDDLNYATLTDALEQTVFENFDDGLYIGMMSGTSLDGMDAVLCQFSADSVNCISDDTIGANTNKDGKQPMQLLATVSQDFPPRLREVLLALCQPNGVNQLIPTAGEPSSELDWFGWASKAYAEFASDVVNT